MQTIGLILFIVFAGSAAIWLFGSIALRVAGVVFIVAGLAALVPTSSSAPGPSLFCVGFGSVCWLSGHLLYAWQHGGVYRSPVVARLARGFRRAAGGDHPEDRATAARRLPELELKVRNGETPRGTPRGLDLAVQREKPSGTP